MNLEQTVVEYVIERYIQEEKTSTVREIAEGLGISQASVRNALRDDLGMTRSPDLDTAFEHRTAEDKHYGTFAPTKVYKTSVWYPSFRTLVRIIRELREEASRR